MHDEANLVKVLVGGCLIVRKNNQVQEESLQYHNKMLT